jgi:hypothetical protein
MSKTVILEDLEKYGITIGKIIILTIWESNH